MPGRPRTSADTRCIVIVDEALPPGLAANAVGVLALTLGATLPALVGADLIDADGERHPGLIPCDFPIASSALAEAFDSYKSSRTLNTGSSPTTRRTCR